MDDILKKYEMSSEEAKEVIKGISGMFILIGATGGLDNLDGQIVDLIKKLPLAVEYACDAIDLIDDRLRIEKEE